MNKERIIAIDSNDMIAFVSRKPLTVNSDLENLVMGIDQKIDVIEFQEAGKRLSDYEIVDTTDWEYNSYEELMLQISNYEPKSKGR